MKISSAQLEALLKTLLPTAELVDDESEGEGDMDAIISAIDANREPIIRERVKDSLHQEITGKLSGALMRQLIRQTGIPEAELSKAGSNDAAIALAIKHNAKQLSSGQEDLQKTLESLQSKHSEAIDKMKSKYEEDLLTATNKYQKRDIEAYVRAQVDKVSVRPEVDKKELTDIILGRVKDNADLVYDEEKEAVVVLKKGSQSPALNKSQNGLFDWQETIEGIISPLGVIAKDTGGVNPADAMTMPPRRQEAEYGITQQDFAGINPPKKFDSVKDFNEAVAAAAERH